MRNIDSIISGWFEDVQRIRVSDAFKDNVEELYKLGCASIHNNNNFDNYDTVEVHKIRLDEDLKNTDIAFIKIDVEGHEREVIEGAKNLITKYFIV